MFGLVASSISGKIHYWARKAGVNIHTHSLRDNYASTLNERGASIRDIQELLGHSSLANTERYTLLNPRHLKDVVEVLDDQTEEPKQRDGRLVAGMPLPGNPRLKELGPKIDKVFGPRIK